MVAAPPKLPVAPLVNWQQMELERSAPDLKWLIKAKTLAGSRAVTWNIMARVWVSWPWRKPPPAAGSLQVEDRGLKNALSAHQVGSPLNRSRCALAMGQWRGSIPPTPLACT